MLVVPLHWDLEQIAMISSSTVIETLQTMDTQGFAGDVVTEAP